MNRSWLWLIFIPWVGFAQDTLSLKDEPLTSTDSLAIFQLLDSLINMESLPVNSQFAIRTGYTSNINARTGAFNLSEFGATTRVAFYHKSGIFADVGGFWSNQYSPEYYLTIPSIGYMNYSLKNWSFLIEYSRYIYNLSYANGPISIIYTYNDNYASQSFKNSFTAGIFYQWRNLNLKFDYSLLTGSRTGHTFNPTIFFTLKKNNLLGLDKIYFAPTLSILLGIERMTDLIPLFKNQAEFRFLIRNGINPYRKEYHYEFGVMNYGIRFPLSLTKGNWGLMLSYTYNFPKNLPGEIAIIENGGSLSFSVVRYLEIKGRKKN